MVLKLFLSGSTFEKEKLSAYQSQPPPHLNMCQVFSVSPFIKGDVILSPFFTVSSEYMYCISIFSHTVNTQKIVIFQEDVEKH